MSTTLRDEYFYIAGCIGSLQLTVIPMSIEAITAAPPLTSVSTPRYADTTLLVAVVQAELAVLLGARVISPSANTFKAESHERLNDRRNQVV